MYTLLSGLYKYLTQKEDYYVIILGLDNAGKTVGLRLLEQNVFNEQSLELVRCFGNQTLLEKIKSIFSGTPGVPPDKIAPTVGLNSASSKAPKRSRKLAL